MLGLDQMRSLAAHRRCELLMELLCGCGAGGRHTLENSTARRALDLYAANLDRIKAYRLP